MPPIFDKIFRRKSDGPQAAGAQASADRLAAVPGWRWMRERTDSPRYPSVRLYRQQTAGDWGGTLARVAGDLRRTLGD